VEGCCEHGNELSDSIKDFSLTLHNFAAALVVAVAVLKGV
jgi:hypothetical protein